MDFVVKEAHIAKAYLILISYLGKQKFISISTMRAKAAVDHTACISERVSI